MKRIILFVILFLSFSFSYAQERKAPFELNIVVPQAHGFKQRQISYSSKPSFHAILKNISDKSQKIWNENYSWGYENLSFELIIDNEKIIVLRTPKEWNKNYPDYYTVEPNEYFIFDIDLASGGWEGLPQITKTLPAKIKAIYNVKEEYIPLRKNIEKESGEFDLWTGKIESQPLDVFIYP